jgi:phage baseplate assembly protein W
MAEVKLTKSNNQEKQSSFLGAGWSFPPNFNKGNHQLTISSKNSNIKQSIDIILQTPTGTRNTNPEFGCELNRFLFSRFDASLAAEIINCVQTALLDYEPRIKVESVEVNTANDSDVTLLIGINYKIKMTNSRDNHIFPFYLNEASNLRIKQG